MNSCQNFIFFLKTGLLYKCIFVQNIKYKCHLDVRTTYVCNWMECKHYVRLNNKHVYNFVVDVFVVYLTALSVAQTT
jgi:hypothetical protein